MYFTKLRLNGLTSIDLPIVNALPSDMYILKAADGLGPPEVDVSISNTLNAGGFYQGRRPQAREIVVHIGLNPNYGTNQTVSDLRQSLYGLLTPGLTDKVRIELMDEDEVLVYTEGYVSKMEIVPFSPTPEVQLTIRCTYQYLLAPNPLYLELTEKENPVITNIGTAPSGFSMILTFTSDLSDWWSIEDNAGRKMLLQYAFLANDTLRIDTRPGFRGIFVTRAGALNNIIWSLSSDSVWHMLHGGDNVFETNSPAFDWEQVFYIPQYWGI